MGESLNPTLTSRVSRSLRPDWTRTILARRVLAGSLVVLAGFAAVRPDPSGDHIAVVVAAHDIKPGNSLAADDVLLETRLATTVPDGAAEDLVAVLGAVPAGPVRRGEVLTDVRFLGRRLTESTAGPDARIVPVRPADAALADLVRPGDLVDVVAVAGDSAADHETGPRLVAADGIVVLVSDKQNGAAGDRVVLVAFPAAAANVVAAAALAQTVTLTLR